MVDTKGPEVRTGTLPGGVAVIELRDGMAVVLTFEDVFKDAPPAPDADSVRLHVDYAKLPTTVSVGSAVLLDDGLVSLKVTAIGDFGVRCVVENSGPIKARKGVNLPGSVLDLPALTDKDKSDLEWAVKNGADFIAASFVRSAANVRSCIAHLERCQEALAHGSAEDDDTARGPRPLVISKIENQEGVDNFDEILAASDGIMVARGDLGVEIDYEKVFAAQKMMVAKCNSAGKPVIVATQMLDSMQKNPRPTRAEVTDVAAAVIDGADAVMLSGETAAGKYPLKAIAAMAAIAREAEAILRAQKSDAPRPFRPTPVGGDDRFSKELDATARSAVSTARNLDAKAIMCITVTGSVARAIARHRPSKPVLAFCYSPSVARKLQLHRGIHPVLLDSGAANKGLNPYSKGMRMGLLRSDAIRTAKELGFIEAGDLVVSLDRNTGKATDAFKLGTTLKVFTVGN
ncbi:pyruvate kinase [Pelagophyceae sp. CCMP2097]|nr:pyruvate kinase [Pelagophyceae sp. CCMP2097]